MNDFFKRNLPVFLIGGATLLIFIFIIIAAQNNPPTSPELIEVDAQELLAPHTYVKGLYDAPISVVEFSDFGCPACKAQHPIMTSIAQDYPTLVSWGYRHFPLPQHKNADKAAIAAQAAGEQGKFWEYADILFENQGEFSEEQLVSYASQLGLDVEKFKQDSQNKTFEDIVNQDIGFGRQLGVNATPTFFINGKQVVLRTSNDLRLQIETMIKELGLEDQVDPEIVTTQNLENLINQVEETFGVLEISFTESGFSPKDVQGYSNQKVVWTNETENDIELEQITNVFKELQEPVLIKAGEKFEFILKDAKGLWTYTSVGSDSRASIFINDVRSGI